MRECVLEEVLPLRHAGEFTDQLGTKQVSEGAVEIRGVLVQRAEAPHVEEPSDDGRLLEHNFRGYRQSVDTGGQHATERWRNRRPRGVTCDNPVIPIAAQGALLDEGPDDLFEEERIAFGAFQDELPDVLRQVRDAKEIVR